MSLPADIQPEAVLEYSSDAGWKYTAGNVTQYYDGAAQVSILRSADGIGTVIIADGLRCAGVGNEVLASLPEQQFRLELLGENAVRLRDGAAGRVNLVETSLRVCNDGSGWVRVYAAAP